MSQAFEQHPHRTIVALSLPVLGSLVAEPLTGLVDTGFVARLGTDALAALGVGTLMLSATLWIFGFLGVSTQTDVGRLSGDTAAGAHDPARLAALAISLAALIGIALIVLGVPFAPLAARAMGAEGRVGELAVTYAHIRLLGAPAVLMSFAAFGALRGRQDMRTPLWIAVVVNGLNIVLDYWLIFGGFGVVPLGVRGAAIASTMSQWVGAFWAVAATFRRLGRPDRIDWRETPRVLRVGWDLFLRSALLNLFLLVGTRTATRVGSEAGAVHQVIRSTWMFCALFLDSFALSGQSLVAFFVGREQVAQARRVAWVVCQWSFGTGVGLGLAMLLAQPWMERVFVPPEALALFGVPWWISALSQPINALSFGTDGIHWGTGDFRYLRNAVFAATAIGLVVLTTTDVGSPRALSIVWVAAVVWVSVRAILGVVRVWPGVGNAPLRRLQSSP